MINFLKGDIFQSKAQTLVNPVNLTGFMGKGLALVFKQRFPAMYEDYREKCVHGDVGIGDMVIYKDQYPWILNFPTKKHYRHKSNINDITVGLQNLREIYKQEAIESMALPALGCGEGGLEWEVVKELMVEYLGDLPIKIEVYLPGSDRGVENGEEERGIQQLSFLD